MLDQLDSHPPALSSSSVWFPSLWNNCQRWNKHFGLEEWSSASASIFDPNVISRGLYQ